MEKVWKSTRDGNLIDLRRVDALLIEQGTDPHARYHHPQPPNAGDPTGWGVVVVICNQRHWLYLNDRTDSVGERRAREIAAMLAIETESYQGSKSGWMVNRQTQGFAIPEQNPVERL